MTEQTQLSTEAARGSSAYYVSPRDVLQDPTTSVSEKRALLASWASDARAVADSPALRQLDNGAILYIDDVFNALKQLDEQDGGASSVPPKADGRRQIRKFVWRTGQRRDDDDDPPPCPVSARWPRPVPTLDAACAA